MLRIWLNFLLRVLRRRLQPQGYWPIVRVPQDRSRAGGLYGWARNFGQIITHCVEECMQLPLDENDFAEARSATTSTDLFFI